MSHCCFNFVCGGFAGAFSLTDFLPGTDLFAMELFPAVEGISQMMHLIWTSAFYFLVALCIAYTYILTFLLCVCVSVCEEVAAPTSYASLLQLNSFSSFPPSLCLVLVSPGFPPSKVSVELDPGLFFSLPTVGDGFCYRCQLLLRSFSLCFFKSCGWRWWQEMLSNRNSELM